MNPQQQLDHIKPLLDQIQSVLVASPDASPRFQADHPPRCRCLDCARARSKAEATAQPKAKTALAELAEWLDKVESHYPATGYMRQQLATWAQAVREADEQ